MKENIAHVSEGKMTEDSVFYISAIESLGKEEQRLADFTDALDNDPAQKKDRIAEYKCAKYRNASVSRIHNLLYHGNRVYRKPAIHLEIEDCINSNDEILTLCNKAADNEKLDCKLYYGISYIAQERIEMCLKELENANDWEKIELEERIGGMQFAKECLDEAWQKRKEVSV